MKKLLTVMMVIGLALCLAAPGLAKDFTNEMEVIEPTTDGNDLMVPDRYIQTIPEAADNNVFAMFHDRAQPIVRMAREGKNWRIPDIKIEENVGVYVGDPLRNYKPETNYAKIEQTWSTSCDFVELRTNGPCLKRIK